MQDTWVASHRVTLFLWHFVVKQHSYGAAIKAVMVELSCTHGKTAGYKEVFYD